MFQCNQCKKKVSKGKVVSHLKEAHGFSPQNTDRAHEFFFTEITESQKFAGKPFKSSEKTQKDAVIRSLKKQFASTEKLITCEFCSINIKRSRILLHLSKVHGISGLNLNVENGNLNQNFTRKQIIALFEKSMIGEDMTCKCPFCKTEIKKSKLKKHIMHSHKFDVDSIRKSLDTDRNETSQDIFDRKKVFQGGGVTPR